MDLQLKVIINEGIAEAVLVNQNIPISVEIIDVNKDYDDYEALEVYRDSVYQDTNFKECDYTVAHFDND